MREIKFRGWDEELKKWHYGNYYFYTDTIYCIASDKDHEENEHHCILFDGFCDWNMPRPHYKAFVNKDTIGQYTGLKDKNGVEIYEGDIFIMGDRTIEHIVEWHDTGFMGRQRKTKGSYVGLSYWNDGIEVVGNIHQRKSEKK